jgi:eukaryotic-like serine/threonine-protein kinase
VEPVAILPGNRLGPYEILSAIGAGGMGEVYRARDTRLDRIVAIKVLPVHLADRPELRERFEREARTIASLNHPHICTLYDVGHQDGTDYLVMEYLEGETLAQRLIKGPLPLNQVLQYAIEIADALDKAHRKGVTHRDLKPGNIMLTKSGTKLLDFGLAKLQQEVAPANIQVSQSPTMSQPLTAQGTIVGTLQYMAPEQLEGKEVDARTDIFAFGTVVYEMATGKRAFEGKSQASVIAKILETDPPPISSLQPMTPTALDHVVKTCLAKDPDGRWQAASDLARELKWITEGGSQVGSSPTAAAKGNRTRWRGVLPWAVAGVLFVNLAALAFVHLSEKPPLPAEPVRFDIPMPPKASLIESSGFRISPDGRKLAFGAANPDGTNSLWIRDLGSPEARPLASTESGAEFPFFWTANGKYLVFQQSGTLKKIDVSSGVVETLCDLSSVELFGSSNAKGEIIFGQGGAGLMKVSAKSGAASPLTALNSARGDYQDVVPSFLPDGRHFIYLRVSSNPVSSGIYAGSLDDPPGKQNPTRILATSTGAEYVPSSNPDTGHLLFLTQDGTLMAQPFDARRLELTGEPVPVVQQVAHYINGGYFSASANGVLVYMTGSAAATTQLAWFDRQGKIVGTVGEPGDYYYPALSRDGTRVVVGRGAVENLALWLFDLTRGTGTRFTFDSVGGSADPIWSPDGKRIIFSSNPGGISDLYQKLASGAAGEDPVLKSSEHKYPSDVSGDGRFLLYSSLDPKTKNDIWVLPLQGDGKPFPFLRTTFDEQNGHFSPDGHWIAYVSDESGRYEVYVRAFSPDSGAADASGTGAKWQVSYGGGQSPQWSADGKQVYYLTLDSKVMEVNVTTSSAFQSGTPKLLFQAPQHPLSLATGDYTIDGEKFLFLVPKQTSQTQAPFSVVLNWQGMLKQQP